LSRKGRNEEFSGKSPGSKTTDRDAEPENSGRRQISRLQREIKVFPQPQFTVAYGAAISVALEKGFKIT